MVRMNFVQIVFAIQMAATSNSVFAQEAVLIRHSAEEEIAVEEIAFDALKLREGEKGLVVWADAFGQEHWRVIDSETPWPPKSAPGAALSMTAGASRGETIGGSGQSDYTLFASTVQLAPLTSGTVTRGGAFITPPNRGEILSRMPTLRRLPAAEGEKYPAATAILFVGRADPKNELLRIPFAQEAADVAWRAIPDLPEKLADGLEPGQYTLRVEGGLEESSFTVVETARRDAVYQPIDDMTRLVGDRDDPLVQQFAVAHLLSAEAPREGEPPKFLADALEFIDAIAKDRHTPQIAAQREGIFQWLANLAKDPGYRQGRIAGAAESQQTGIQVIDEARTLIAAGRWTEASELLGSIDKDDQNAASVRVRGLALIYQGVISAEAGRGLESQTESAFEAAIGILEEGELADRFRAHNNYANYLLHRAQDTVDNHAFQMAAGVRRPFLAALQSWVAARREYRSAEELAGEMKSPFDELAVQINVARLDALLADIVRTLDAPGTEGRRLTAAEDAARRRADQSATDVVEAVANGNADALIAAVAWELRAHLAFRAGRTEASRKFAQSALEQFVRGGHLAGAESIQRLLGLNRLADDRQAALRHFLIAHHLSELLRTRFPQDQVGLTRAGFFARRSFVYEKIVELLIEQGQPEEALRFAEMSKARAARDILISGGVTSDDDARFERPIAELLADWPSECAALEYFLGAEQAWVFLVTTAGEVVVFPLQNDDGRPVESRAFIHQLRDFLSEMEGQSAKMTQRLLSGRGFEHAWQDKLYEFHKTLVPAKAAEQLRAARQVLIVPHHILHYFPFAALVSERDEQKRGNFEMVSPKFMLDEPYHLVYAPSLTTWDLLRASAPRPIRSASAVGIVQVPGAPPLPGVAKDLENFKTVFADRLGAIYENNEGTVANALAALRRPGVLLFATHGMNVAEQPLESHLLFLGQSGASQGGAATEDEETTADDGRLTAREIYAARVRADLIVTSACYSGLGDRSPLPGDDLFGLQRAFLQSGARAVVSGLWDVYDGTAPDLIYGMFKRVADGMPVSEALADSQRVFLEKLRASKSAEPWLHPYFWAVYTVAGDDRVAK
ncbi:MAG: CHAT domain-containing protein [Planctomycetales bacterium]|nr:CHAT domain-containing protein [Planctomycetales bacterium]